MEWSVWDERSFCIFVLGLHIKKKLFSLKANELMYFELF